MNATKRKFNALLQGIGTRSTTSVSAPDKNSDSPRTGSGSASSAAAAAALDGSSYTPVGRVTATSEMLLAASSSASADVHVLSKRRRIGLAVPSPPPPLKDTSGNVGTTISNIVLRKFSGSHGSKEDTKRALPSLQLSPPRYCPGDRDQLLKRLATFQELTDWTPKPDRVGEIEWAKRGWVCQGRERVRCTLCDKEMVVKLNKREVDGKEVPVLVSSDIDEALVDRYVGLIVTSHHDECLWRKKGCDDSLLRLPLANPHTALPALRRRYDELCARKDFLPYEFNLRLPDGFSVDAVLQNLPPDFFTEPPPAVLTSSSSPNRVALVLAVMGWQGLTNSRIGPVPNSASCQSCLRRLGLWMFKSKQVDLETNTILVPAPMDHLDPVREHRFFCPWKNGVVQRNPGAGGRSSARSRSGSAGADDNSKAGWEVLARVIKNDGYLRSRVNSSSNVAVPLRNGAAYNRDGAVMPLSAPPITTRIPGRPGSTAGMQDVVVVLAPDGPAAHHVEVEDEATRDAKDKERWARLRKVKSLFDTKGGKKLKRTHSRPGTGHSTLQPDSSSKGQA